MKPPETNRQILKTHYQNIRTNGQIATHKIKQMQPLYHKQNNTQNNYQ